MKPILGWNRAFKLRQTHIDTILWELRKLSIFFADSIEVRFPSIPWTDQEGYTVGHGYGGVSETFTTRGELCVRECGKCCENVKWSVLIWHAGETWHHPDAMELPIEVNSEESNLWVWPYITQEACEFVDRETKDCVIHDKYRASMCHFGPQTGLYKLPKSDPPRLMLSRRIVSRNWRWPNCPIVVAENPFDEHTHAENMLIVSTFERSLEFVDPLAKSKAQALREKLQEWPYEGKGRIFIENL